MTASIPLMLVAGCGPSGTSAGGPGSGGAVAWQWVALRGIEVQVPADWGYDYDPVRPDCIDPDDPDDPWAEDVPDAPYVTVGTPPRPVPAIGCMREQQPGDPDPAFGQLPFSLWQPLVRLQHARPDLGDPSRKDGQWQFRDWQLTRETIEGVQVTVLAPPEQPDLGGTVLDSARQVETTSLGCAATSPAQAAQFARPEGAPLPEPQDVEAVAICDYARTPGSAGLEGSRRVTGPEARQLVEAIRSAPGGGGPDSPQNCSQDMYGDRALVLRFFQSQEDTTEPLAEAHVYFDWCFGNGIFDSEGARSLTEANCPPLFAEAPIGLWGAQRSVAEVCGPLGAE